MSYEKQYWTNTPSTPLIAESLNAMDDQIYDNAEEIEDAKRGYETLDEYIQGVADGTEIHDLAIETRHIYHKQVTEDKLSDDVIEKLNKADGLKVHDVYSFDSLADDKEINEKSKNIIDEINKEILEQNRNYGASISSVYGVDYSDIPAFLRHLSFENFFSKNQFCFDKLVNEAYACFIKKVTESPSGVILTHPYYEIYMGLSENENEKINIEYRTGGPFLKFGVNTNLAGNKMYKFTPLRFEALDVEEIEVDIIMFKDNNYNNYYNLPEISEYTDPEILRQVLILNLARKTFEENNYIVHYKTRNIIEQKIDTMRILQAYNGREKIEHIDFQNIYQGDNNHAIFWFYDYFQYPFGNNIPSDSFLEFNYYFKYENIPDTDEIYTNNLQRNAKSIVFNCMGYFGESTENRQIQLENIPNKSGLINKITDRINPNLNLYIARDGNTAMLGNSSLNITDNNISFSFSAFDETYLYNTKTFETEIYLNSDITIDFRKNSELIAFDDLTQDLKNRNSYPVFNIYGTEPVLADDVTEQGIYHQHILRHTLIHTANYSQIYISNTEYKYRFFDNGNWEEWQELTNQKTIGELQNLTTTDKTNIVSAINEIHKNEYTGTQSEWDLLTEEQKQGYDIVYIYE